MRKTAARRGSGARGSAADASPESLPRNSRCGRRALLRRLCEQLPDSSDAAPRNSPSFFCPGWRLDALVVTFLLFGNGLSLLGTLGTVFGRACCAALLAACALRLLLFRRWADETPHALRFFAAFAALLIWLLIENCAIWAVSASDLRRHSRQEPLQDNVELLWAALLGRLSPRAAGLLEGAFAHEWIGIKEKLVALVLLGFSAVFDEVPFSGFGMCTRTVVTIMGARMIRTVAFCCTVLPSPRPGCFDRRFPPVPDTWAEFFAIGFSKMRSSGGCNDLVISGHGTVYTAVATTYATYYPGYASKLLWLALWRSNIRGPLTHQHYAVDMFLATAVTWLVWIATESIYPPAISRLLRRPAGLPADKKGTLQWILTGAVFAVLALLACIIIVGGA